MSQEPKQQSAQESEPESESAQKSAQKSAQESERESEPISPTDLETLLRRLVEAARHRELLIETLGELGGHPLLLFHSAPQSPPRPRLLVAAGFHGDEPAGCWGALRFLETVEPQLLARIELSMLPVVNPTGLRANRRNNDWGQNPNAGYFHPAPNSAGPSVEGQLLLANLERLSELAADGLLTLHEDPEQQKFYVYTGETTPIPGAFSSKMAAIGAQFFPLVADGPLEGAQAQDGIIFNFCADSFDDALFHRGVPRFACSETPGLLDFELRVRANSRIIEEFFHFLLASEA